MPVHFSTTLSALVVQIPLADLPHQIRRDVFFELLRFLGSRVSDPASPDYLAIDRVWDMAINGFRPLED